MQHNDFLIAENEKLTRIDKFLADKFQGKSRTYFQYLIDNGCVQVNGQKVKKRFIPKCNDEIEIFFQALPDLSLEPENIPLDILYEDEHILAVNKPSGMVVHPACGNWTKTFVNALLFYCKDIIYSKNEVRPGIVHRLDKDTTGVLLAAKTKTAHEKLIEMFKNRQIIKTYLAITANKPPDQTINAPVGRHPKNRKEMAVIETGRQAVTEIKVLSYNDKISLVECSPKTGRTHQIRVHLKYINCPVIGDEIYGNNYLNKNFKIYNHLLHALSIEFNHPITGKNLKITAPINDKFKKFINILS